MTFTGKECATKSGLSPLTIQKHISSGKLSAKRNQDGNYVVDPAEFYRAYPAANIDEKKEKMTANVRDQDIKDRDKEIKHLNEKISLLNKQIDLLAHQLEQSQARENKLLAMADSTTKLLTHEKETKKRKWFGRRS